MIPVKKAVGSYSLPGLKADDPANRFRGGVSPAKKINRYTVRDTEPALEVTVTLQAGRPVAGSVTTSAAR